MSLTRSLASLPVLLVAGPMLAAQVFVVDAAGGAGSHFTDLPAAVSAVPNGATLRVRAGNYSAFIVDGKGLAVVGEGLVGVSVGGFGTNVPIVVRRTAVHQPVLLKGLTLTEAFPGLEGTLEIRQAAGAVVLDTISGVEPATGFIVDGSANVLFHNCSLGGVSAVRTLYQWTTPRLTVVDSVVEVSFCVVNGHQSPWVVLYGPTPGTPALKLVRSRCIVTRSTLRGGWGSPGCNVQGGPFRCWIEPPGKGGVGVDAEASTMFVRTSTIAGARGHDAWIDLAGPVAPGDGGDGLVLRTGSRATALASMIEAGAGGQPNGRHGVPSMVDATSTLVVDPFARPTSVELGGTHARGGSADFVLLGAAMSPAVLLFSYRADIVSLEPIAFGSMLSAPPLVLGPFTLSSVGDLRGSIPLSATWPVGETYFAQVLSLAPGTNTIWPSNRVVLHVNH